MVYVTAQLNVENTEMLAEYRSKAGDAMAKHGGKPLVSAPSPKLLEGTGAAPDIAALLSFPDRDAALGWINDPELAPVHDLRKSAGASQILLLE